jgi:hypothetical protein
MENPKMLIINSAIIALQFSKNNTTKYNEKLFSKFSPTRSLCLPFA